MSEEKWKLYDDPNLAHLGFKMTLGASEEFVKKHLSEFMKKKDVANIGLSMWDYAVVRMLIILVTDGPHVGYNLKPLLGPMDRPLAFQTWESWAVSRDTDPKIIADIKALFGVT